MQAWKLTKAVVKATGGNDWEMLAPTNNGHVIRSSNSKAHKWNVQVIANRDELTVITINIINIFIQNVEACGHLHDQRWHGVEAVRQGCPYRRRRRKHTDGVACCHMEVLVAPVALGHHPGGDTGVVLGYLAKVDRLRRLAPRDDQLLLDG